MKKLDPIRSDPNPIRYDPIRCHPYDSSMMLISPVFYIRVVIGPTIDLSQVSLECFFIFEGISCFILQLNEKSYKVIAYNMATKPIGL